MAAPSRWKRFHLLVKVVELRLRFVLLLAATGLTFAYWDTIWNHYDKWMRPRAEVTAAETGFEYYCPMHPQVVRDEPGSCPICGMPLAKRKKGETSRLPEGVLARVQLAPFRVHQAGIETAEVAYAPLTETLTTVGTVEFDERKLAHIASKVRGMARIEKLHVNFTGVNVAKGQVLAELYSPELYQAVNELLLSQRAARSAAPPRTALGRTVLGDTNDLLRLASEKLKLWGITQAQIDDILRRGQADFKVPIVSPISGHVIKKNVVEGQYISEGQPMFEVADLSTVWVQAQVYEDQVGLIREGQGVEARVEAFPGRTFAGTVEFVQPHLDPATRTVEVRYSLKNPDRLLRPGMFAMVTLTTPVAETPMFRTARRAPSRPTRHASLTAEEQKTCPVTGAALGSMGDPVPTEAHGHKIWTCCGACPPKVKAEPARYLARVAPTPSDGVLSVPEAAVIDTGQLTMVYIETEPGVYEGRPVVLGPRSGDRFPVLDGLAPGDKVVASGAFLVDAESRLNPASRPERPAGGAPMPSGPAARTATAPHRHGG